jgi:hypothetical protein
MCRITGLICDYCKIRLGIPCSTSLILVSFLFFTSQVSAAVIGNIKNLWIASSLLGFAYGNLFSLLATLCSEWFGMRKCSKVFLLLLSTYETFFLTAHFAENWGYIAMAPLLAGNLFSLMFGRNLDAHESASRGVSDAVDYHVALRMGKGAMGDSG